MSGTDATALRYEHLVGALRKSRPDPHVGAALELLIEHDFWLHRSDFVEACVRFDPAFGDAWVTWWKARELYERELTASTTERAVLDVAVSLAEDRFCFHHLDTANRGLVAAAVARALGQAEGGSR